MENIDPIACYVPAMVTMNGMWQGDNPLDYALPLFVLQLTLAILTTRVLIFILRPLRQPRVFAEILVGSFCSMLIYVLICFSALTCHENYIPMNTIQIHN